ncbi:neutral zinc metallopeptidase [Kribbella sp. NPDC056861]|uniref:neutral zinc metallopeptidase n=1 Tax=Kribbella sp. NPDC056861 TaxID=3154857 RepID=UPI00342174A7
MWIRALVIGGLIVISGCGRADDGASAADAAASEVAKARSALPSMSTPVPSGPEVIEQVPQPAALTGNGLYRGGRPVATGCREPAVRPSSLAAARSFFQQAVICLDRSWAPVVRKAGFVFRPAQLVVTIGQSPSSPCDVSDGRSFYCNGTTIYLDAEESLAAYREAATEADRSWVLTSMGFLISHEYGHHLQELTGITAAQYRLLQTISNVDFDFEETRRHELQASCLGGVFFGANPSWLRSADRVAELKELVGQLGDEWDTERTHGQSKNHSAWSLKGLAAGGPAVCNTYTVTSELVS